MPIGFIISTNEMRLSSIGSIVYIFIIIGPFFKIFTIIIKIKLGLTAD